MPAVKFTREQLEQVRGFLRCGMAAVAISRQMKSSGVIISASYVRDIHQKMVTVPTRQPSKKKRGRQFKLNSTEQTRLKNFLTKPHPPTLSWLSTHFGVAKSTIYQYRRRLNFKKYIKPRRHEIKENSRVLRKQRSWPLYKRLANGRWMNFITSDETMIYLDGTYKTRGIQYVSSEEDKSNVQVAPRKFHPKSVMVWVAFCAKGFLKPIFVPSKAKVNSEFYIDKILKPMIREANELYGEGNWIFHQDSAPSHTAKKTIEFLKNSKVKFIAPSEWPPHSHDCAPCDFWLFSHLKREIRKHKVSSVHSLKLVVKRVLKKIPIAMIHRVLEAWPKRLRQVYNADGGQIERLGQ